MSLSLSHERRPTGAYYERRHELLSQGDIFLDVPLAYPLPADEIVLVQEDSEESARRFLSGPFDTGPGMLSTPTCSMRAQGFSGRDYAHPVRTLLPIRPVSELMGMGVIDAAKLGLAKKRDSLISYMFLPAAVDVGIAQDSLALLYMPITVHHDMIIANRRAQLTYDAAAQLQKKLTWHASSVLLDRSDFEPAMD